MDIGTSRAELTSTWTRPALAIGVFDGVHRGHQALLARAVAEARRRGATAAALTFDPHPAAVLAPASAPPLLTSRARRLELMAAVGLDACVILPFTPELAMTPAEAFVDELLVRDLAVGHVVIGWDWRYGQGRAGTAASLATHGLRAGFSTEAVAAVEVAGGPASSTRVRSLLAAGDVAGAAALLGRPHDVDGVVVHGAKRGRALGVPTANLALELPPLVPLGIYATWLIVDGVRLPSVTSLGTNPTFVAGGPPTFEVHVLDWAGDLYDRRVRVELVARLRGEVAYTSVEALLAQIRRDVADARAALAAAQA